MTRVPAMLAVVAIAGTAAFAGSGRCPGPPCATDAKAFRASEAVLGAVEDARWVVTVRDAGSMMSTGAGDAARSFLSTLASVGTGESARDAASLLGRTGDTPAEGFARLARREIRIAILDDGAWVAFARLESQEQTDILARWAPSVEPDGTLLDVPTGISIVRTGGWLVLASARSSLPAELPGSWQATAKPGTEDPSQVARIEAVARRRCGEPVRALGECEGERFSMRIRFSADGPDPFPGPVPALDGPEIELSEAELDAIAGESVVCEIASLRTDLAAEDGPVLAALPEVRVPATFRKNLGARRVVSIGEVDGRSLPEPLRMNCPAVAVAYEVEDAEQARGDQDALVRSALAGIRRRLESDPETAGAGEGLGPANHENREVSLTSAVERFAGRNPWYSAMGLAWGTVDGPTSRWQVYASHPEWRDRVERRIGALESDSAAAGRTAFVSIGRFDGERLARHLEGWLGERNRFDGVCEVFWQEISVCSRLAHHVPELRWKASRRGEAILVEIDARLVKP